MLGGVFAALAYQFIFGKKWDSYKPQKEKTAEEEILNKNQETVIQLEETKNGKPEKVEKVETA